MIQEHDAQLPIHFLKLGGSLITDKSNPHTHRPDVLARLVGEIKSVIENQPGFQLVIGHGSGSFGHVPGNRYGTRHGVHTPEQWRGFAEVWYEASALTRIVIEAMHKAGLPVIALSPSAAVISQDGKISSWDLTPITAALQQDLLPLIHGDVVFDKVRGGTILSTEDLFDFLARKLLPTRILLAGIEEGVWEDYPECNRLVTQITPENYPRIFPVLGGSNQVDVTGGMASKVQQSLALITDLPNLVIQIFSGEHPGNIEKALRGEPFGTVLRITPVPDGG